MSKAPELEFEKMAKALASSIALVAKNFCNKNGIVKDEKKLILTLAAESFLEAVK